MLNRSSFATKMWQVLTSMASILVDILPNSFMDSTMNPQDSPWPKLGGSRHLPPYIILYVWPRGQHPNVILSWDSQFGVLKFPKLGLLQLWKPITLCTNLRLKWDLKQSCGPRQELSNDMQHATYTPPTRKKIRAILDF
jgi:hypothetical protein